MQQVEVAAGRLFADVGMDLVAQHDPFSVFELQGFLDRGAFWVATPVGGIPEAIDHGVSGLLVPERAPDELAAAVLRFLDDPAEASGCGVQGAASVRGRYSGEASIRALEEIYDEVVATIGPAQPPP